MKHLPEVPKFLAKPSPAKIPDADIRAMRRMKTEGKTPKQIALEFPHVSQFYVYEILAGTTRKRVKP